MMKGWKIRIVVSRGMS